MAEKKKEIKEYGKSANRNDNKLQKDDLYKYFDISQVISKHLFCSKSNVDMIYERLKTRPKETAIFKIDSRKVPT